ncbi:hypothetical protein KUTeg_018937 [Tegillarca granosa]|uniref:Piezo non-specific cation channel cap domain-containing protein n=1 Tax=Tegillarca granosa TaxID=220873 RepID=A0ABQ9EB19_TEGGR|nr:hypothetical protein KUTeg_018937 [Tegillarca granosa]
MDVDRKILTLHEYRPFQKFKSYYTSSNIIGLYVSLVIVVGRFIRVFVTGQSYRVMFEELPNVDNILNLCMDIYMVRESGDFLLEEDLFAKLLFVYRCPEILIKWTKLFKCKL